MTDKPEKTEMDLNAMMANIAILVAQLTREVTNQGSALGNIANRVVNMENFLKGQGVAKQEAVTAQIAKANCESGKCDSQVSD